MPRNDGTGPMGMGPMTGRGAGLCRGDAAQDYTNLPVYGCGFGRGRGLGGGRGFGGGGGLGGGRGFRRMYQAAGMTGRARYDSRGAADAYAAGADEKEFLQRQASLLESQLSDVKSRLADYEDAEE
jgi:hypothetical protein